MIKEILPANLFINISKIGPHIYFFKTDNDDINKSIVSSINEFASKYKNINILQINWEKQLLSNHKTLPTYMNTVFLYFKNEMKRQEVVPNREKIEEIFQEGLNLYKKRLELSLNLQGTNDKIHEVAEPNKINCSNINQFYLKHRKIKLVREWIKLCNTHEIQSAMEANSEISEIIRTMREKLEKRKKPRIRKIEYKKNLSQYSNAKIKMQMNIKPIKSTKSKDILTKYQVPDSKKGKIYNFQEWYANIETNKILPNEFLDNISNINNSQISKTNKTQPYTKILIDRKFILQSVSLIKNITKSNSEKHHS